MKPAKQLAAKKPKSRAQVVQDNSVSHPISESVRIKTLEGEVLRLQGVNQLYLKQI